MSVVTIHTFNFPCKGYCIMKLKIALSFIASLILFISSAHALANPKYIHVFVALADNLNQGIVPVPKMLGDGNDQNNNLYWGALYGVKTYFRNHPKWELINVSNPASSQVLERCVFKHKSKEAILIADAYKGKEIKQAIIDFLNAAGGNKLENINGNNRLLGTEEPADLVVYIGHNGLMDFKINKEDVGPPKTGSESIILACNSKEYFSLWLSQLGSKPILLTTGLMAPEAYTLEAALNGWLNNDTGNQIHNAAVTAYNKYQKCGIKGAENLFYFEK